MARLWRCVHAQEISQQMGKPLSQALGEVNGLVDRTRFVAVPLALALPLIAARSAVITSLLHREVFGVSAGS